MDEKIITVEQAFQLALDEAAKGAPFVSPNPLVGCVIVDENHRVLATGYHAKYGEAHAEADALRKLQPAQLKNATVYVTLEPCAHEGKTPSCARALAKLPIKKVVYGLQDPNPLVSGQGAAILNAAGIQAVEYEGPLKNKLEEICEIFLKNFKEKKLFVAAKVASSLDGQIALKSGESKWITGPEAREKVHALRANYDAIVIGRKTIQVDDPSLDIRHPVITKETKLIVLDPSSVLLRQINEGKVFKFLNVHAKDRLWFAVEKPDAQIPFQQIEFSNLIALHEKLWDLNIRSLFIEGGAETYSRYLQANLIDRLHLFLAPTILGALTGLSWTGSFGIDKLSQKRPFKMGPPELFGNDIYLSGRLES